MLESGRRISEWSSTLIDIKKDRLQLEVKLKAISEAHFDMNPYLNGTGMDFFVLPRPVSAISVYSIRAKELDDLVEYNNTKEEDGMLRIEGHNAAIFDIGVTIFEKIVGDMKRSKYFDRTVHTKNAMNGWYENLMDLRLEAEQYPVGVESRVFTKTYRNDYGYSNDEPIFGKYSDENGVLHVSDVLYPQRLSMTKNVPVPASRIILFPSWLEGIYIGQLFNFMISKCVILAVSSQFLVFVLLFINSRSYRHSRRNAPPYLEQDQAHAGGDKMWKRKSSGLAGKI